MVLLLWYNRDIDTHIVAGTAPIFAVAMTDRMPPHAHKKHTKPQDNTQDQVQADHATRTAGTHDLVIEEPQKSGYSNRERDGDSQEPPTMLTSRYNDAISPHQRHFLPQRTGTAFRHAVLRRQSVQHHSWYCGSFPLAGRKQYLQRGQIDDSA